MEGNGLFQASSLNRPHPPVKETPSHFPFSVIGKVFDIHGHQDVILSVHVATGFTFRSFITELSRIAAVCTLMFTHPFRSSVLPHRPGHQVGSNPLAYHVSPANQLRAGEASRS